MRPHALPLPSPCGPCSNDPVVRTSETALHRSKKVDLKSHDSRPPQNRCVICDIVSLMTDYGDCACVRACSWARGPSRQICNVHARLLSLGARALQLDGAIPLSSPTRGRGIRCWCSQAWVVVGCAPLRRSSSPGSALGECGTPLKSAPVRWSVP